MKNLFKSGLIGLGTLFVVLLFVKSASAATLYISPASGSFGVGSTFTVTVFTNTQGDAVNTAETRISYSTENLDLVSIKQGGTFYLASPGSPSKGSGSAYFGGGLPTPGYTGSGGALGVLTFRAKALGTATVSVDSGQVLLNDGLGTDALNGTSNARFNIVPPPVGPITVTSSSHPNPESWYPKSNLELAWNRPTDVYGYSFDLDKNPDTVPDSTLDTTVTTTKSYADLKDGVWYFHIKGRGQSSTAGFGATTHFRIGIDTQKPLLFDISLVSQSDLKDVSRTPTIQFEGKDETSGIDHYDIYLDDERLAENASSPYTFSKLENGPHVIRVVSVDKAGNDRKAELPIIVNGPASIGFFQKNLTLPMYLLLIMNLLILILLIIIVMMLYRRKRSGGSVEVDSIQTDIDADLEQLKHKINSQLLSLGSKTSSKTFKDEVKVVNQVSKGITKTRQQIDKKISKLSKKVRTKKSDPES